MTSLGSTLQSKQPQHDAIAEDINRFLDSGRMIEILAPGAWSGVPLKFNPDDREGL